MTADCTLVTEVIPITVDMTIYEIHPAGLDWPDDSWPQFAAALRGRWAEITGLDHEEPPDEFWITTDEPLHTVALALTELRADILRRRQDDDNLPGCTLGEYIYTVRLPKDIALTAEQWDEFIHQLGGLPHVNQISVTSRNRAIEVYTDPRCNLTPNTIRALLERIQQGELTTHA